MGGKIRCQEKNKQVKKWETWSNKIQFLLGYDVQIYISTYINTQTETHTLDCTGFFLFY